MSHWNHQRQLTGRTWIVCTWSVESLWRMAETPSGRQSLSWVTEPKYRNRRKCTRSPSHWPYCSTQRTTLRTVKCINNNITDLTRFELRFYLNYSMCLLCCHPNRSTACGLLDLKLRFLFMEHAIVAHEMINNEKYRLFTTKTQSGLSHRRLSLVNQLGL